jgi:hypothetical protein
VALVEGREASQVSLSDGGLILFDTCLWNIAHSKWFLTSGAYLLVQS